MEPLYTLLVPAGAIALFAIVLRWAFSTDTDRASRTDYGLLREVAKVPSPRAARMVERRLQEVGVRATSVPGPDGESLRILVFPTDERTAIERLLREEPPEPDRSADEHRP